MRIRTILSIAFLFAILVPTFLYGMWSYRNAVREELEQVDERHLLIAENLGYALERYRSDLVSAVNSISAAMVSGKQVPRMAELMKGLQIEAVFVVDRGSGDLLSRTGTGPRGGVPDLAGSELEMARGTARLGETAISPVLAGPQGRNELLVVNDYGRKLAVARIGTSYFERLAGSVAFGDKGHAAIVDQEGNILAHPLPDWVAERRNIAKISIVQRMIAGETGIERFYSPALKGDMIAGFTTVPGAGWGIMVPQPVSELHDRAIRGYLGALAVLAAGITFAFIVIALVMRSFVKPLESMVRHLKQNAASRTLETAPVQRGMFPIRELTDVQQSYNHMVTEVTEANRKLRDNALKDMVTGLPNRTRFHELAEDILKANLRDGIGGIVVYIDLDDFKEINDLHGHDVGDDYLRHCAEKLVSAARIHAGGRIALPGRPPAQDPLVARIGGDEFALLYPGMENGMEIRDFLSNLRQEICLLADEMGIGSNAGASLGCAAYPADATTTEDLIKLADIAMYRAKQAGKNQARNYDPATGGQTVAEIRRSVLNAIDSDELMLEYQPKVRASDWTPHGAEALVRWHHPERGILPPDIWLPAIADSAVISRLGEWVVGRAIRDRPIWAGSDSRLKLAINFGVRHFVSPGFAEWLDTAIRSAGIDHSRIVVEITEDTLLTAADRAQGALQRLHERGFAISVDDFGKGYSNIARLAQLPVDQLKIDRSIVAGAMRDKRLQGILNCILDLASALDCETVAEGIETVEQAEFMSQSGADILQGYYFSKSLPPEKLARWLAARERDHGLEDAAPMRFAGGQQ